MLVANGYVTYALANKSGTLGADINYATIVPAKNSGSKKF